jgi:hypothetical protein
MDPPRRGGFSKADKVHIFPFPNQQRKFREREKVQAAMLTISPIHPAPLARPFSKGLHSEVSLHGGNYVLGVSAAIR